MGIRRDLDEAICKEAEKIAAGKRIKPSRRWRMGRSALHALAAEGGAGCGPDGLPTHYRDIVIEHVEDFNGWELYA